MFQKEFDNNKFSFIFAKEEAGDNLVEEIKNFIVNKKAFFFSAIDFGKQSNINRLYKEMFKFFENEEPGRAIKKLKDVCEYIISKSNERIVWIFNNVEDLIDEEDFGMIESLLKELKKTNDMMIFISKSASFSNAFEESKLIKYVANNELNNSLGFYALEEEKNMSAEDKFKYYAIFGTKKAYRKKIDFSKGLKTNIVNSFLKTDGFFYSEPNKILKNELRETQIYNIILEAVSKGASTLNQISDYLDMPTSICNKYITVLISLGIMKKIKPVFGRDTRKSRYRISNNAMDFWYYFVPDNMSEIELNNGDNIYEACVNNKMEKYLQMKFPDLCKEYIDKLKKENKIKLDIRENDVWWNKDDVIDIVAGSGLEAITADCFWKDEVIDKDALENLEKKAKNVDVIDRQYYLFSKKGFSKELVKISNEREDVKLFTFAEMVKGENVDDKPRKMSFFFSRK